MGFQTQIIPFGYSALDYNVRYPYFYFV